ncbi:hypothetical protein AYI68_g4753 [Smittium mucronatum]|uniref:Uncharacterized protein n=1 Tax=Smittium mucronatum TaxID=133383 RepID=A0A1R0GWA3_9FUNG|nr:hypothetical protein AYI68_g4753 [Smittium mucronatum]
MSQDKEDNLENEFGQDKEASSKDKVQNNLVSQEEWSLENKINNGKGESSDYQTSTDHSLGSVEDINTMENSYSTIEVSEPNNSEITQNFDEFNTEELKNSGKALKSASEVEHSENSSDDIQSLKAPIESKLEKERWSDIDSKATVTTKIQNINSEINDDTNNIENERHQDQALDKSESLSGPNGADDSLENSQDKEIEKLENTELSESNSEKNLSKSEKTPISKTEPESSNGADLATHEKISKSPTNDLGTDISSEIGENSEVKPSKPIIQSDEASFENNPTSIKEVNTSNQELKLDEAAPLPKDSDKLPSAFGIDELDNDENELDALKGN